MLFRHASLRIPLGPPGAVAGAPDAGGLAALLARSGLHGPVFCRPGPRHSPGGRCPPAGREGPGNPGIPDGLDFFVPALVRDPLSPKKPSGRTSDCLREALVELGGLFDAAAEREQQGESWPMVKYELDIGMVDAGRNLARRLDEEVGWDRAAARTALLWLYLRLIEDIDFRPRWA